ncbi:hypothetical protein C8Q79DRAFT_34095 [Trametes meyenii]|nr:hypothetical protein C8Q79DRAFT_34095 [Trametes meyenii]
MASSTSSSFVLSHSADASLHSSIRGWDGSSLVDAFPESPSSQEIVPPGWHINSDPLAGAGTFPPSFTLPTSSSNDSYASSSSSTSPSPALRAASPHAKKTTSVPSRRAAKSPDHIPRPRNAFMIFRSEHCTNVKESRVEHDHRMISKILGEVWRKLDDDKKDHYKQLAAKEKREHAIRYPNYRFSPQQRAEKAKKRKVKRNGPADKQRCETVAKFLLAGKGGNALKAEIDKFDMSTLQDGDASESSGDFSTGVFDSRTWVAPAESESSSSFSSPVPSSAASLASSDSPAFRSPLLPPSTAQTPAIRSPLDMPHITRLDTLSPLSPMQVSPLEPQPHAQAPALGPVPLPQVPDPTAAHFPSGYPPLYPIPSTDLGLGLLQHQGELGLSQMYALPAESMVPSSGEYVYPALGFPEQQFPVNDVQAPSYQPQLPTQLEGAQSFCPPMMDGTWDAAKDASLFSGAHFMGGQVRDTYQYMHAQRLALHDDQSAYAAGCAPQAQVDYGAWAQYNFDAPLQGVPQPGAGRARGW